jgi:hypothetical protein
MRKAGYVEYMGKQEMQMVGKPQVKRPLGRPKHKRINIINTYLRETGC